MVSCCACFSFYSLLFPGVAHELFHEADFCSPRFCLSTQCILGGHTNIYQALTGGSSARPEVGHGSFCFLFPFELEGQLKERSFWSSGTTHLRALEPTPLWSSLLVLVQIPPDCSKGTFTHSLNPHSYPWSARHCQITGPCRALWVAVCYIVGAQCLTVSSKHSTWGPNASPPLAIWGLYPNLLLLLGLMFLIVWHRDPVCLFQCLRGQNVFTHVWWLARCDLLRLPLSFHTLHSCF